MNSPVMLWVILEEQRMAGTDPRRHHPVATYASRPVRRTPRFAALLSRLAAPASTGRLAEPASTSPPVPGAAVARLPMGCSA